MQADDTNGGGEHADTYGDANAPAAAPAPALWLPTDETPIIDAALAYAEHGFRVTPVWGVRWDGEAHVCQCGNAQCGAPGKHPVGSAWQKRASSEPNDVLDLFHGKHRGNIGIVVGSSHVLVDVDGDEGRASLAALEAEFGPLPETLTSTSGRGEHRLFRLSAAHDPKRITNRPIRPKLDVKIRDGQFVAAPSMHASGRRYTWRVRVAPALLPDWMYAAMLPAAPPSRPAPGGRVTQFPSGSRYVAKVVENAARDVAQAPSGTRNATLFAKATGAFEFVIGEGLSMGDARATFESAARAVGLTPLETQRTLDSAASQAAKSPRRAPERARPAPAHGGAPAGDTSTGTHSTVPPSGGPPEPPGGNHAWEAELTSDSNGRTKKTFGNVCKILRNTPKWDLAYNEMRLTPELNGRPLEDADIGRLREQLLERRWSLDVGKDTVQDAIVTVASENAYHPLRDYLRGLEWDGKPYLERIASCVLGIREPDALTVTLLRRWAVSAVARALKPGAKVDTVLVLVGAQGAMKSSFFRVLAGDWFGESRMNLRDKDSALQLYSAWIYEWPEIDELTLGRSSSEVKAFLTQSQDNIRPPYMRAVSVHQRHTVIVGSTNHPKYLNDSTGSRRFQTISVPGRIDIAQLAAWRDQIWAEAVAAYEGGEQWWLTADEGVELETRAADHTAEDPWVETIRSWLAGRGGAPFSVNEILVGPLDLRANDRTKVAQMRVADCLRVLGFHSKRIGADRTRVWAK